MEQALTLHAATEGKPRKLVRDVLLVAGVVASVAYVVTDIAAAMSLETYSYRDQAISELMAIESPMRPFMAPSFLAYGVLMTAFGLGVLRVAGTSRALQVAGWIFVVYGPVNVVGFLLCPMHVRGAMPSMTPTDVRHIVATAVGVAMTLLSMGFVAAARGTWFRRYTVATVVLLVVCGVVTGLDGARIAGNLPTPWVGVTERINVYLSMLWVAVLAVVLLVSSRREEV